MPFILPSVPNGLRTALDAIARQQRITLAPVIEADSLPLQKSLVATERLYTVLPMHAVWNEVAERTPAGGARSSTRRFSEPSPWRLSKSKGPARAVTAVASQIVEIVDEMARAGMWRRDRPAVTGHA